MVVRRGLIAISGLVLAGLGAVLATDHGPARITANTQRPVAIATLACGTGLQAVSSGFVYDDRLVVTVAHAIHDSRDFAVRDARGDWHEAVIWRLDLERDLAVLRVEGLPAARMATATAPVGAPVHLLDGAASGPVDGVVVRPVRIRTAAVGDPDRVTVRRGYELDLAVAVGDSGAGIVDDAGNLVAVVFARSTGRIGVSWATAVDEVEQAVRQRGVPTWTCGPGPGTELVLAEPTPRPGR